MRDADFHFQDGRTADPLKKRAGMKMDSLNILFIIYIWHWILFIPELIRKKNVEDTF